MERRAFIASLGSLVAGSQLAACTTGSDEQGEQGSSVPQATEPTSTTAAPTPQLPLVEPLPAPDVELPPNAFALGVASGDPDAESVIIWTRVVGNLPDEIPMVWEMATDEAFTSVIATGPATTHFDIGYSVKVLVRGLVADSTYWYRFRSSDQVSAVGRTKTFGGSGPVTIGFGCCQDPAEGKWAAHIDLAADQDVDAVVWLGDFVYEAGAKTLDVYRTRYSAYRRDPVLQASCGAHPWLCTIDDNEIKNDYSASLDPERRFAGLQAWWENTPTRLPAPTLAGGLNIYRSIELSESVRLILLDTRQFSVDGETIIGSAQGEWLEDAAAHAGTRTIIASPVTVSPLGLGSDGPDYIWEAFPEDSELMRRAVKAAPKPLLVSGDLHAAMRLQFTSTSDPASTPIAPELMCPPISSSFPAEFASSLPLIPLVSSNIDFAEANNGWLKLTVGADAVRSEFRFVTDVQDPQSGVFVTGEAAYA